MIGIEYITKSWLKFELKKDYLNENKMTDVIDKPSSVSVHWTGAVDASAPHSNDLRKGD